MLRLGPSYDNGMICCSCSSAWLASTNQRPSLYCTAGTAIQKFCLPSLFKKNKIQAKPNHSNCPKEHLETMLQKLSIFVREKAAALKFWLAMSYNTTKQTHIHSLLLVLLPITKTAGLGYQKSSIKIYTN